MRFAKKGLPILFALLFVYGASYYLFSVYRPDVLSQVKGAKSTKSAKLYLDTIPLPSDSQEVGRNVRDGFSQLTVSSPKSSQELQKFFRGVLISKGWKVKTEGEDLLSVIYARDGEKIEVSVLSLGNAEKTIFSISYAD